MEAGAQTSPPPTGFEKGDAPAFTQLVPSDVNVVPDEFQEMSLPVPGSIVTGEAVVPTLILNGADESCVNAKEDESANTLLQPPNSIR